MKFCLLGDLGLSQSVASFSEDQFSSGSFGFVRGWTSPTWALRLGTHNGRIWRRSHRAATERTVEQNIVPPVHLWWFSATRCSSSGRRSSVDFSSQVLWPNWARRRGRVHNHLQYWKFSEARFNVHTASQHKDKMQRCEAIFVLTWKTCMYEIWGSKMKKRETVVRAWCNFKTLSTLIMQI